MLVNILNGIFRNILVEFLVCFTLKAWNNHNASYQTVENVCGHFYWDLRWQTLICVMTSSISDCVQQDGSPSSHHRDHHGHQATQGKRKSSVKVEYKGAKKVVV